MHATSVYIAREQFIRHQPVVCTLARSEDICTRVVRALLHTRVFVKFKSSCTVCYSIMICLAYPTKDMCKIRLVTTHIIVESLLQCYY